MSSIISRSDILNNFEIDTLIQSFISLYKYIVSKLRNISYITSCVLGKV